MSNPPDQDPLVRLEKLAELIPGAKKGRELGDALEKALESAKRIEPHIQTLDELYRFILFFEGGYDRTTLANKVNELKRIGEETELAVNIEQLSELRVRLAFVPSGIETVEHRLTEAWHNFIQGEFSTVGSLGEVLKEISETAQLGRDMAATHEEAKFLGKVLPAETQQKKFNKLVKNRESLFTRLEKLGAGPEVVAFLIAVANQEATLAHATSAVHEWLDSRNAIGKFRIGLAPPDNGS